MGSIRKCFNARRLIAALTIGLAGLFALPGASTAATTAQPAGTSEATAIKVSAADVALARRTLRQMQMASRADGSIDPVAAARVGIPADAIALLTDKSTLRALAACGGRDYTRTYSSWWQGTVYVIGANSCTANGLAAAFTGTAAIYGILSAIVAGSVVGIPLATISIIAAGIFAGGAAAVQWCNRNGTGSEYRYASRIGVYWCVQQ